MLGTHCSAMFYTARQLLTTDRLLLMVVGPRFGQLGLGSHLLGKSQDGVAQRVQGARGLAMGGTTPDTHGRSHGLCLQGWPSPQEGALRGTVLLDDPRKARRGYPEDVTRSDRIRTILCFLESVITFRLSLRSNRLVT